MQTNTRVFDPAVSKETPRAFTIVELLAIVIVLGVLASLLATSMAGTRTEAPGFRCRNNLRQLVGAWSMYADDNGGRLVYNTDGGSAGKTPLSPAWVAGWLDFTASTDNTSVQMLVDELHRWRDPRTDPQVLPGVLLPLNLNLPGDVDIPWLQQRAAGVRGF